MTDWLPQSIRMALQGLLLSLRMGASNSVNGWLSLCSSQRLDTSRSKKGWLCLFSIKRSYGLAGWVCGPVLNWLPVLCWAASPTTRLPHFVQPLWDTLFFRRTCLGVCLFIEIVFLIFGSCRNTVRGFWREKKFNTCSGFKIQWAKYGKVRCSDTS